ncbi:unnamed protein product [Rhodiola kirilowii]
MRLVIMIFILLADESRIIDANDHRNAKQHGGPIDTTLSSNGGNGPMAVDATNKVSSSEVHMKIHEEVKRCRKLMGEKKQNVGDKRQVEETMFEPGSDHKSVDTETAGSVAFSADYRSPRHHPPKNN